MDKIVYIRINKVGLLAHWGGLRTGERRSSLGVQTYRHIGLVGEDEIYI